MIRKILLIAGWCLWATSLAPAQNLINDQSSQQVMLKALNHIYNWEFAQANQTIEQVRPRYGIVDHLLSR